MKQLKVISLLFAALVFAACEKFVAEDDWNTQGSTVVSGNLIVKAGFPQTKGGESQTLAERFVRIGMAVYQDGKRVDYVNQDNEDNNFGTMSLDLPPGSYKLLVVAHSCSKSASTNNFNKVSFTSPLSDVFAYETDISITTEAKTIDATLTRATARVDLVISDEIPVNAASIMFNFKGGATTLNAETMEGVSSSTHKVVEMEITDREQKTYSFYTFACPDGQKLKVEASAYDANGQLLGAKVFNDVTVERNRVTSITSPLFSGPIEGPSDISITVDDSWGETITYPI
ncbi:MAG: FimB/Mfa2 family fimbrial subunit [Prevotella sp.]|nr:FimB/Mfa2 family fimbrial subunit [Prevotella sp.]